MPDFKFPIPPSFPWLALVVIAIFSPPENFLVAENLSVQEVIGKAFVQPKKLDGKPPHPLKEKEDIGIKFPYAVITSKNSFVELCQLDEKISKTIRMGRSTAIEFSSKNDLFLFQGSFLVTNFPSFNYRITSSKSSFDISGQGTWIVQHTQLGFKLLALEGKLHLSNGSNKKQIQPGELILVSDQDGKISQSLQIELPLLLATSKLINQFTNPLPSQARLTSAAQVQVLRMKKKYEAMVGGVSNDRKLRIWSLEKTPTGSKH